MYPQEDSSSDRDYGQPDLLPHETRIFTGDSYAGFWLRFAALLIDGVIVVVFFSIVLTVLGIGMMDMSDPDAAVAGIISIYGGLQVGVVLYFTMMESSKWQATLGKRAVGILVTDMEGRRISFGRAVGRYFAKLVSAIIIYIGFFMAGFTDKKQGLHDMIAGTLVIKEVGNRSENF